MLPFTSWYSPALQGTHSTDAPEACIEPAGQGSHMKVIPSTSAIFEENVPAGRPQPRQFFIPGIPAQAVTARIKGSFLSGGSGASKHAKEISEKTSEFSTKHIDEQGGPVVENRMQGKVYMLVCCNLQEKGAKKQLPSKPKEY